MAQEEERAEERTQEQPLDEEQRKEIARAYRLFEEFHDALDERHARMDEYRKARKLEEERRSDTSPRLNTLNSTIDNVIADQMDNLPAAVILPETPEKTDAADLMTDVVRYCLETCGFEDVYAKLMEDAAVIGTGVAQVYWDEEADRGMGMAAIQQWPAENFYPDPYYENWQDGRAVFKTTYTTWGWIKEHYPDAAEYVRPDEWAERDEGQRMAERGEAGWEDRICMVMEYWRRTYDAKKKRYNVSMMLLSGRALLEEDRNVYAHGEYPFVPFFYRDAQGEAFGRGLMDDYAEQWYAICRYAKYIDDNARQSSRTRFIIRRGMDISDVSDYSKDFIEVDATDSITPFQTASLNPQVMNFMQYLADTMKQDSGQNQFSRGEGGMGVTAAGAIQALQEAGGKTTRMHTRRYKEAFRNVVRQMIWILSEYIEKERVLMITGGDTLEAVTDMSMQKAVAREMSGIARSGKGAMQPPPYNVRIQVQKRSPLEMQAWNDQVYQIVNLCAQSNMPLPPTAVVAMLRGVEEKQTVLRIVGQNDQTQLLLRQAMEQAQQAQAQAQGAAQENEMLRKIVDKQHEYIAQQPDEEQQADGKAPFGI